MTSKFLRGVKGVKRIGGYTGSPVILSEAMERMEVQLSMDHLWFMVRSWTTRKSLELCNPCDARGRATLIPISTSANRTQSNLDVLSSSVPWTSIPGPLPMEFASTIEPHQATPSYTKLHNENICWFPSLVICWFWVFFNRFLGFIMFHHVVHHVSSHFTLSQVPRLRGPNCQTHAWRPGPRMDI